MTKKAGSPKRSPVSTDSRELFPRSRAIIARAIAEIESGRFPDPDLLDAGHGELACKQCGEPCWIEESGVSHHWGDGADDIDHEADADHVAVPEPKR